MRDMPSTCSNSLAKSFGRSVGRTIVWRSRDFFAGARVVFGPDWPLWPEVLSRALGPVNLPG
jgi:hypothetical protein